jgi:hypothetical protein
VLLGFDAREMISPALAWDDARREEFLLRREVARPLSVDDLVWPSVFGGLLDLGWTGPVHALWDDLGRMDQKLRSLPRTPSWRIAVAWVREDDAGRGGALPTVPETKPDRPGDDWSFLGFDVADGMHISGLSNCGYEPSERIIFRRDWSGQLNEHHLFEDPATAREFRDATNVRVPEHAPFFVFALFRIDTEDEG